MSQNSEALAVTSGKYRIGTVAKLTGFSADVLRAWERRHGLLEPERGPGGQRLYSDEDLLVLEAVARRLAGGRPIGEVALLGRKTLLEGKKPADAGSPTPAAFLDGVCCQIVEAAIALDGDKIEVLLDVASSTVPPATVIARVIEPAARDIGEAWAAGHCSVAGEHLASGLFVRRLSGMIRVLASDGREQPRVLCACFPNELHEIGALVVAYHLTRMGLRVTYLGPNLPLEDLETAVGRLQPQSVYLSASRRAMLEAQKPLLVEVLERHAGEVAFVLGGHGVPDRDEELTRAGAVLWPGGRPVEEMGAELAEAKRRDA